MYPQDPQQPSTGQPAPHNPLAVMQPGERVICDIKRHPIGIIGVFVGAGLFLIVLAILGLVVAPSLITSQSHSQVMAWGGAVFFIFALLSLGFVFISNVVYWGNRWVVTSDSITQITQTSLFKKQSSQLSLGNLEDVMAEQNGILAQMFHFGVLKAETAGERSKFVFLYCPTPNLYAQQILAAREQFEQGHRGGKQPSYQQPYQAPSVPSAQLQPPVPQPEYPQQTAPSVQDPGYGAYQPYVPPTAPTTDYPEAPVDHGINIGTE